MVHLCVTIIKILDCSGAWNLCLPVSFSCSLFVFQFCNFSLSTYLEHKNNTNKLDIYIYLGKLSYAAAKPILYLPCGGTSIELALLPWNNIASANKKVDTGFKKIDCGSWKKTCWFRCLNVGKGCYLFRIIFTFVRHYGLSVLNVCLRTQFLTNEACVPFHLWRSSCGSEIKQNKKVFPLSSIFLCLYKNQKRKRTDSRGGSWRIKRTTRVFSPSNKTRKIKFNTFLTTRSLLLMVMCKPHVRNGCFKYFTLNCKVRKEG